MNKSIIFFLPKFTTGGAGNSIKNICLKLKDDNKNTKITTISLIKNDYKKILEKRGIKVIELNISKTLIAIFKIKKYLIQESKNYKVCFVSNINYANVLTSIFLTNIKNVKTVLIERTPIQELMFYQSIIEKLKRKIIKILMKFFYSKSNYIIGNSLNLSKDLSILINKKVNTIYPIIKISKSSKKKYHKSNIAWIGRNSLEKNLNDFLLSLKLLNLKNKKIFILTDSLNINQIPKIVRSKISIIKFFNDKRKIHNFYKKINVLVSTSYYEGFPNVIAEAIDSGCVIVSSRSYGGAKELIKNQDYGYFYNVNNIEDLKYKIELASIKNSINFNKIKKARKNLFILADKHNNDYLNFFKKEGLI